MIAWLDKQNWFHELVRSTGLRRAAGALLRLRPLRRRLPSGAVFEIRDLESLFLFNEIVVRNVYGPALERTGPVRTVVDVGCNVGFFACYLRHCGGRDLRGLAIDANPKVLALARRNLDANGLPHITTIHALVGEAPGECEKPFFLYPSHLGSSRFPREEPGRPPKGPWRRIRVPTISLVELCSEARFPDGIDLLKIDIEGSEADLLRHDAAVLPRVRAAVVEIHRWLAAPADVACPMEKAGLKGACLSRQENTEIWFFSRR